MAGGYSGTSEKTKLSLAEVLAKLDVSGDKNESLSDLTQGYEELVGDFEEEENEVGFLDPVVTDNGASVNPVFQTKILLGELDGEAASEIMPIFSLCITV